VFQRLFEFEAPTPENFDLLFSLDGALLPWFFSRVLMMTYGPAALRFWGVRYFL
jgi:hypothetical protein